jgi:putative PIN family toxin of toxin-antitoxin system
LRLILDTNVVLDLLHFADALTLPILSSLEAGNAQCYASEETLDELQRVLTYAAFGLDEKVQLALHARYQAITGLAKPSSVTGRMPRCRDPDDQMFLELAASTQADLLVSKDKALLALKRHPGLTFKIVTPVEACALLSSVRYVEPPTPYALLPPQIP